MKKGRGVNKPYKKEYLKIGTTKPNTDSKIVAQVGNWVDLHCSNCRDITRVTLSMLNKEGDAVCPNCKVLILKGD